MSETTKLGRCECQERMKPVPLLEEKIAALIATADGGCETCAKNLAEEFQKEFPEVQWWHLVAKAGGWAEGDEAVGESHVDGTATGDASKPGPSTAVSESGVKEAAK